MRRRPCSTSPGCVRPVHNSRHWYGGHSSTRLARMSRTTTHEQQRTDDLEELLERYRRELTAYAYRMLGSTFEAEDAVQETFLRAWKSYDTFQGRASLRSWLYTITTNVCLDMLGGKERRARPIDLAPASTA